MARPVWALDTSSLIALRSTYSRARHAEILAALTGLVSEGRLVFPKAVVEELERYAGRDNPALLWAKAQAGAAAAREPSWQSVKDVLSQVPEVLDPDKEGTEEADPYLLAMVLELRSEAIDARIVTEEFKTSGAKMNLGSAAGALGFASVSIRTMLSLEGIVAFQDLA